MQEKTCLVWVLKHELKRGLRQLLKTLLQAASVGQHSKPFLLRCTTLFRSHGKSWGGASLSLVRKLIGYQLRNSGHAQKGCNSHSFPSSGESRVCQLTYFSPQ